MIKFIMGVIFGFILGTTYPDETMYYTKIFLEKIGQFISTTTKKLDENRDSIYDEEYLPNTPRRYDNSNF